MDESHEQYAEGMEHKSVTIFGNYSRTFLAFSDG